jgi:glycine oxidase
VTRLELIVLGAGAVGLSVARAAARRGASVVVFDSSERGGRGSRAAAGVAIPSLRLYGDAPLLAFAEKGARRLERDVRELEGRADTLINGRGILRPVWSADERAALEAAAGGSGADLGEWLDAADVHELEPLTRGARLQGAFSSESGFVVDADRYVSALSRDAVERGVKVALGEAVLEVHEHSEGVLVRTSARRTVYGKTVVVAAGAWSGSIPGLRSLPVAPRRGQMLEFESSPNRLTRVVSGKMYLAPGRRGKVVVGATEEDAGFSEAVTPGGLLLLATAVGRMAPELLAASVTRHWAGLRSTSATGHPLIARMGRTGRVIAATGHGGQGIMTAALTGDLVAGLLDGERDDLLTALTPLGGVV